MRHACPLFLIAVAISFLASGYNTWLASAEPSPIFFNAQLDGEQSGLVSGAVGTAEISLDTDSSLLFWNLSWSGFSTEVVAIHFHGPADLGEDAFVQVELGFISGLMTPSNGEATISETQQAELLSELWYINIHTQDFIEGEIRGQVIRAAVTRTPTPLLPDILLGDVECGGGVNSIDAALLLQFLAALLPSLPCPERADVNQDNTTNSIDAALILQFTAGLLLTLPP